MIICAFIDVIINFYYNVHDEYIFLKNKKDSQQYTDIYPIG